MRGIGDPLVWRHSWCEERQTVIHQYKMTLADESSFECDEWGPWIEKEVNVNDQITGQIVTRKVLRSDPMGVALIRSYPDVKDFPGLEDWIDMDMWKGERVFEHLQKWKFHRDAAAAKASWDSLHGWHMCHQDPNVDVDLGEPMRFGTATLSTTPMPWSKMWEIILDTADAQTQSDVNIACGNRMVAERPRPFLHPRSKERLDREALSKSTNVVEKNIITNPNYTDKQQRAAIAKDPGNGVSYLHDNLDVPGALFLIKLNHKEGEFPVGLGRRTFDPEMDCLSESKYHIHWFERKNKKRFSWGDTPCFVLAKSGYDKKTRKAIYYVTSVESFKDFIPLAIQVTKASLVDEPRLTLDTVDAIRSMFAADKEEAEEDEEEDEEQDAEEEVEEEPVSESDSESEGSFRFISQPSKRKRK